MEFTFLCPDACFDVFKVAVLGFKLGVRGSLGPFRLRRVRARRGPYLFEGQGNFLCLLLDSPSFSSLLVALGAF